MVQSQPSMDLWEQRIFRIFLNLSEFQILVSLGVSPFATPKQIIFRNP